MDAPPGHTVRHQPFLFHQMVEAHCMPSVRAANEGGRILQDNMVAEATEADDGEAPLDLGLAKKKKKKKKVPTGCKFLTISDESGCYTTLWNLHSTMLHWSTALTLMTALGSYHHSGMGRFTRLDRFELHTPKKPELIQNHVPFSFLPCS
jgi:hypothetical protein